MGFFKNGPSGRKSSTSDPFENKGYSSLGTLVEGTIHTKAAEKRAEEDPVYKEMRDIYISQTRKASGARDIGKSNNFLNTPN
jgi:hypothetical protein